MLPGALHWRHTPCVALADGNALARSVGEIELELTKARKPQTYDTAGGCEAEQHRSSYDMHVRCALSRTLSAIIRTLSAIIRTLSAIICTLSAIIRTLSHSMGRSSYDMHVRALSHAAWCPT